MHSVLNWFCFGYIIQEHIYANLFCTGFFHLHYDRCLPFRSTRCNYYGLYKYGSTYCQCSFFFFCYFVFFFLIVCFQFFLGCIWSSIFACVLFGSQLLVFFPQIATVNSCSVCGEKFSPFKNDLKFNVHSKLFRVILNVTNSLLC